MNKVYNTVWNESTGMWVVTSELTRKGGRRPRQIRRTALAGLIAGLLLPSAPALATYDENQTLESGGKSSSMRLSAGDTATNPTINNGHQYVSNGSSATGTTINSGGHQHVSNGGSATGTIINSGGHQYVNSSGSATGTTINSGGNQYVSSGGSATGTTINSRGYQHVSSGGSATSTTINSGGEQYVSSGGSATSTTIN
ncbi:AIDA repeat-containing protein, partial [Escherichia coli]